MSECITSASGATARFVTITPTIAEDMLKRNVANFRKMNRATVDRYVGELVAGEWRANGAAISFTKDGLLSDGQHRLAAIVKSGISAEFLVVENVDVRAVTTMDRGRKRTVGDVLRREGFSDPNPAASSALWIIAHNAGKWSTSNPGTILDSEVVNFAVDNREQLESAVKMARVARRALPMSIGGAIFFIGSGERLASESTTVDWFARALRDGESLDKSDAVLHLRNLLLQDSLKKKLTPHAKRIYATVAWNITAAGEECSSSRLRIRLTGPRKQKLPSRIRVAEE